MEIKGFKTLVTVVFSGLLLTACATKQPPMDNGPAIALAEAAGSIDQSLTNIEATNAAANPPRNISALPNPQTYGMQIPTSIDWNGPIGPLIEKSAQIADYKFRILGTEPAIPILVSIHRRNASVATILQDAGFQASNRANIIVYPSTKTIELRYSSDDNSN